MTTQFERTGALTELSSYPNWAQDIVHAAEETKRTVVDHEV